MWLKPLCYQLMNYNAVKEKTIDTISYVSAQFYQRGAAVHKYFLKNVINIGLIYYETSRDVGWPLKAISKSSICGPFQTGEGIGHAMN